MLTLAWSNETWATQDATARPRAKLELVAGVNYLDRPATTILAGWKRGMISL